MYEVYNEDYSVSYEEQNNGIIKTFYRMFLGLLVTAVTAYITYKTGAFMTISYGLLAIIEIAVVLIFSFMFKKLSPTAVSILFYIYALINGVTMATIFAVFDMTTIFYAFGATSALFGGLALYGYKTQKDMSKFGNIFLVALIIGLIVSVINIFIGNTLIDIVLDWAILLIFCGLTAYDMNKIKNMQNYIDYDYEKLYIYGAMELYLDFINIFIRILSLIARRKD